jgi:hypothetical protein
MADATKFPLQLKNVLFTRIHIEAIPEHAQVGLLDPNKAGLKYLPDNNIHVDVSPEHKDVVVQMSTLLNPERDPVDPYFVDIECIAQFSYSDIDENEARQGATITGHNVVYGAIRETVAWITGRQPYGSIMLGLSILKKPESPTESNEKLAE